MTLSTGGLVLACVRLADRITLEPFIPVSDPDWVNNDTTKIKETHTSLLVYNLTLDAAKQLRGGLYKWDENQ